MLRGLKTQASTRGRIIRSMYVVYVDYFFVVVFKHAHDGWFVVYSVNFLMGYFSLKSFFLCILFLLVKIRINLFQLCKSFHSFFLPNVSSNQITEPPVISFFNQKTLSSQCLVDFFSGVFTSFSIVCSKFVFLSIFSLLLGLYLFRGENTLRFFFPYLSGKIYLAEQFFFIDFGGKRSSR